MNHLQLSYCTTCGSQNIGLNRVKLVNCNCEWCDAPMGETPDFVESSEAELNRLRLQNAELRRKLTDASVELAAMAEKYFCAVYDRRFSSQSAG